MKRCHIGDFENTAAVVQLLEILEIFRGEAFTEGPDLVDGLNSAERCYMASGNTIGAITHMRNRTGLGLREAMQLCKQYADKYL